ncbi:hypothetical protein ACCC92_11260 [Mucilaginibacter sp. Mucisp84]|uniref:hypothetical protein n=1 Tax=Mucilaginibacter sp. Mucisp84 TaxID=3243058 RepID=UPI0039A4C048
MEIIDEKKILHFQAKLLAWFRIAGREFRWRQNKLSPYEYIIAEVLLQRTKAATAAAFYDTFLASYSNWDAIDRESLPALTSFMKPIGLQQQRAGRLKNLAAEMVRRKGRLPRDRKKLEKVPFMGQYLANAVELVIFKRNTPLMDVNMARVLERYFGPRKLADIRYDPYLQNLGAIVARHKKSRYVSWAILDFAALICQARKPRCEVCMLQKNCRFYLLNEAIDF